MPRSFIPSIRGPALSTRRRSSSNWVEARSSRPSSYAAFAEPYNVSAITGSTRARTRKYSTASADDRSGNSGTASGRLTTALSSRRSLSSGRPDSKSA